MWQGLLTVDWRSLLRAWQMVTSPAADDSGHVGIWPRASTVCQDLRLKMRSAQACMAGASTARRLCTLIPTQSGTLACSTSSLLASAGRPAACSEQHTRHLDVGVLRDQVAAARRRHGQVQVGHRRNVRDAEAVTCRQRRRAWHAAAFTGHVSAQGGCRPMCSVLCWVHTCVPCRRVGF